MTVFVAYDRIKPSLDKVFFNGFLLSKYKIILSSTLQKIVDTLIDDNTVNLETVRNVLEDMKAMIKTGSGLLPSEFTVPVRVLPLDTDSSLFNRFSAAKYADTLIADALDEVDVIVSRFNRS
ncbi:MAG: hypothetical protein P1U63_08945 [Coxiellaceae bacterium]|nr:hypothetical protein [Coxiellaceae bacterium]